MDAVEEIKKKETEERQKPFIAVRKFWTEYQTKEDGSVSAEDIVSWVKKGQTIQDEMRSKIKFMPKYYCLEWTVIEPYYKAWKEKQTLPVDGTPLAAWPGMQESLIRVLEQVNIRTVEDFCDMEDSALTKLGIPGARKLQRDARMFRQARKDTAPLVAELSQIKERNEFLEKELADIHAKLAELETQDEPKRGPGRPRKEIAA